MKMRGHVSQSQRDPVGLPEPKLRPWAAKAIIERLYRVAGPIGCMLAVALLVGCGSSSSSSSSTTATGPSASASSSEASSSAPQASSTTSAASAGVSYSDSSVAISAGGFTFNLSVNLTLGTPSTNTDNEQPPYVNVAAPISGSATLTNTTANYTVNPQNIPLIGVFAVYPASSAICQEAGGTVRAPDFHPGPQGLCGVDVAELASDCNNTVQSLANGQSASLVPWAQFAQNQLQPESPQACSNINNFQVPSTLQFTRVTSDQAQTIIGELSSPPQNWVLVNEGSPSQAGADPAAGGGPDCQSDEFYVQGGTFIGQVIASQPAGITGCLGAS